MGTRLASRFSLVIIAAALLAAQGCVLDFGKPHLPRVDPVGDVCTYVDGFSTCAEDAFDAFAAETDGELYHVHTGSEVPATIVSAIEKATAENGGSFDLLFIIDVTGSMADDIGEVKAAIGAIADAIEENGDGTQRVGVFTYGDRCADDPWFSSMPLTGDLDEFRARVMSLTTTGGGDVPESVYDAVAQSVGTADWQNPNRFAILIGDAPPQTEGGSCYMTTYDEAVEAAKASDVDVNLYPILIAL